MGFFDFFKRKPALDPANLMPWVHRRSHLEAIRALRRHEGRPELAVQVLNDAFAMCVAAPTKEGPVPLDVAALRASGLEPPDALVRACGNIGKHLSQVGRAQGVAIWEVSHEIAGAVLALGSVLAPHLKLKGAPVAMLPAADVALMAGEDDPAALELMYRLAEQAFLEGPEYRSLRAVRWVEDARTEAWLPPPEHPLFARFCAGLAETRRREAVDLYRGLARGAGPDLAPLAVVPGADDAALVGAWFRGAPVALPGVDRLVLLDAGDGAGRRVEVDFAVLRGACPSAFVPLSIDDLLEGASPKTRSPEPAFVWVARDEAFDDALASARLIAQQVTGEAPHPGPVPPVPLLSRTLVDQDPGVPGDAATAELRALQRQQLAQRMSPTRVYPALRPPGYESGTAANMQGMVEGLKARGYKVALAPAGRDVAAPTSLGRPGPEGTAFHLVIDGGNTMMPIPAGLFSPALEDAAWGTALLNLEAQSIAPFKATTAPGVYEGPWHDDYDASRAVLLPRLAQACVVQGRPLIFTPTVGRAWVVGSEDPAGIAFVLDAIDELLGSPDGASPYQYRQMLFGWPWTLQDGTVVRFAASSGLPHHERIARLDEALAARRRRSAQHVGSFSAATMQQADVEPECGSET